MGATLYGVSVGPGDPELLTLKAKKIIEQCEVIAAPITSSGDHIALDIAGQVANLDNKIVVYIESKMSRDPQILEESHKSQAKEIAEHLQAGHDVALLNIGDVSVFSTFSYIEQNLKNEFDVEVIPGVTSFCAAAAVAGESLTTMNKPMYIIPAGAMDTQEVLKLDGTKVLMKSGRQLPEVIESIDEAGLLDSSFLVQNCGLDNQKIILDLKNDKPLDSYFSLVVVKEKE